RTIAAEASFNNEIGVPLTLCRLAIETEICVLELAMRGFGQIAQLAAVSRPEVGAITNVGPVHLELVESLEGVARAKAELRAALSALAARAGSRRRVAILGDMAELGTHGPGYHVEIGAAAAEFGVRALVAVGSLAQGYVAGAAGVEEAVWAPTLEEGLEAAA